MSTFADRVIDFNRNLELNVALPEGIGVMNPFTDNPDALEVSSAFYRKFYNDNNVRRLILGINPGRHGAGVTGIPFTDTKRLQEKCGLEIRNLTTHEPSSVFVYDVIDAFGGVRKFYKEYFINSPSPLGFTIKTEKGKHINYNYYDSRELLEAVYPFLVQCMEGLISTGVNTDIAFCMGAGKNYRVISKLNEEYGFFRQLVPLEHPRYIMQYRLKEKNYYIGKYLQALRMS